MAINPAPSSPDSSVPSEPPILDSPVSPEQRETSSEFFFDDPEFRCFLEKGSPVVKKNKQGKLVTRRLKDDLGYFADSQELREVVDFFRDVSTELNLDMSFFDGPERSRFYIALRDFMKTVDSKYIAHVSDRTETFSLNSDAFFPSGDKESGVKSWKSSFRMSAYFAFFLHYAQMRNDGSKYIEHPMKSATYGLEKLGFLDIDTVCATILHDVVEDSARKGIGKLIGITKDKKVVDSAKHDRFLERVRGFIGEKISKKTLAAVDLVTKPYSPDTEKPTRSEMMLDFINRLHKAVSEGRLEDALRGLYVKAADRSDNARTLQGAHGDAKEDEIWAETAFLLLPLVNKLGMHNYADWLYDSLYFMDSGARVRLRQLHQNVLKTDDLTARFGRGFEQLLSLVSGKSVKSGKDYQLIFRPRGFRHEDLALSSSGSEDGEKIDIRRARRTQNGFLHYIIFVNTSADPHLSHAAKTLLEGIFSHPVDFADQGTSFGSLFRYGSEQQYGVSDHASSGSSSLVSTLRRAGMPDFSVPFGIGVTAVFKNSAKAHETLFGLPQVAMMSLSGSFKRTSPNRASEDPSFQTASILSEFGDIAYELLEQFSDVRKFRARINSPAAPSDVQQQSRDDIAAVYDPRIAARPLFPENPEYFDQLLELMNIRAKFFAYHDKNPQDVMKITCQFGAGGKPVSVVVPRGLLPFQAGLFFHPFAFDARVRHANSSPEDLDASEACEPVCDGDHYIFEPGLAEVSSNNLVHHLSFGASTKQYLNAHLDRYAKQLLDSDPAFQQAAT
jgi:hypothetical protein